MNSLVCISNESISHSSESRLSNEQAASTQDRQSFDGYLIVSLDLQQLLESGDALVQGKPVVLALPDHAPQNIAKMVVEVVQVGLLAPGQQIAHKLPRQLDVALEAFAHAAEAAAFPLGGLLVDGLLTVFEVGQNDFEGPEELLHPEGAQRPRLLVVLQEIDEVGDFEGDLSDLEIIEDHIVVQHLGEGAVVVVEDELVAVALDFLLETQFGRDVALARVVALPHADPVEPHQVAAVVALQLLDVKQEGLDFAEGQARVLVDQKGAVIDAGLEQPVAALLPALGTDLIQDLNVLLRANYALLDLLVQFFDVSGVGGVDEFVDDCLVLILLVLFEGDHAVALPVLLHQLLVHLLKGEGGAHCFFLEVGDGGGQQVLGLFYLRFDLLGRNEFQPQPRQMLIIADDLIIEVIKLEPGIVGNFDGDLRLLLRRQVVFVVFWGDFEVGLLQVVPEFLFYGGVEEEQEEVEAAHRLLLQLQVFLEQVLQQVLLDFVELGDGFDDEEGEVGVFLVLALPVLQGLQIAFFVHVLAAFAQLLVVYDVDVGTFFAAVLQPPRVVLEPLDNQLLVGLFLEPEGQQRYLFVVQEGLHVPVGLLPFLLVYRLQDHALLRIGYEYLVFEFTLFHCLEKGHVADCCPQRTYVQLLLELHRVSSVHPSYQLQILLQICKSTLPIAATASPKTKQSLALRQRRFRTQKIAALLYCVLQLQKILSDLNRQNLVIIAKMFKRSAEQEKVSCPFNSTHIFAKEKLVFHINRCKDKPKVIHLMAACKYNGLHYLKKDQLEIHQQICPDREEVRKMVAALRKSYEVICRERERSRERRKREEVQKEEEDQLEEHTLSDCEDCREALLKIQLEKHPKLKKYLLKYEQVNSHQLK